MMVELKIEGLERYYAFIERCEENFREHTVNLLSHQSIKQGPPVPKNIQAMTGIKKLIKKKIGELQKILEEGKWEKVDLKYEIRETPWTKFYFQYRPPTDEGIMASYSGTPEKKPTPGWA